MRVTVRQPAGPTVTVVKRNSDTFADGDLPSLYGPTLLTQLKADLVSIGASEEQADSAVAGLGQLLGIMPPTVLPTTSRKVILNLNTIIRLVSFGLSSIQGQLQFVLPQLAMDGLDLGIIDPAQFQTKFHDILTSAGVPDETATPAAAGVAAFIVPLLGEDSPTEVRTAIGNTVKLLSALLVQQFSLAAGMDAKADLDPETGKVSAGQLPAFATIDTQTGKLGADQLPPLAITSVSVAGSEGEMLAADAQEGDVVVRSDIRKTYILSTGDPTDLSNWVEFASPVGGVSSVNGESGDVVLGLPVPKAYGWGGFPQDQGDGTTIPLDRMTYGVNLADRDVTLIVENPPPGYWTDLEIFVENFGTTGSHVLNLIAESINHWNPVTVEQNTRPPAFRLHVTHGETGAVCDVY